MAGDNFPPESTPIMLHTMDGGATWTRPDLIRDLNIEAAKNGHYLGIKLFGNSIWAGKYSVQCIPASDVLKKSPMAGKGFFGNCDVHVL